MIGLVVTFFVGFTNGPAGEPIVTENREVYVPNKERGKAPWVYAFPGKDVYREEFHTKWSHEG